MKTRVVLIILLLSAWASGAPAAEEQNDPLELFIKAGFAYKDGDYAAAAKIYEQILASGVESGPLYFNLGNAYFKQNKYGMAVLNYERARRLLPRDSDVAANYQFALNTVQAVPLPPRGALARLFDRHIRFYTMNEMILIVTALFLAGLYVWLWAGMRGWPPRRVFLVLGIIAALEAVHVIGLAAAVEARKNTAVMVAAADALFEPRDKATVYFSLTEGSCVHIVGREGLWLKVRRPDGKTGWVPSGNAAEI